MEGLETNPAAETNPVAGTNPAVEASPAVEANPAAEAPAKAIRSPWRRFAAAAAALLACLALLGLALRCLTLKRQVGDLNARLLAAQTAGQEETPPAAAQDVTFQINSGERAVTVYATVTLPPDASTPPLVVMCHGFRGNRQGDGHFPAMAALLAEQGIASIAVDFPGCGESKEPFTEYTLQNMDAYIAQAIRYMQTRHGTDPDRVGLLGHSMGGRAAALNLNEGIRAAALWSPAANEGLAGLEFVEQAPADRDALRAAAAKTGSVEFSRWGVTVSTEFIEQMAASDPWQALRDYQGALLIAFAAGDPELLSQQTIDGTIAAAVGRGRNFTNLYGSFLDATHNYTALDGGAKTDRQIRARLETATADFFAQALLGGNA